MMKPLSKKEGCGIDELLKNSSLDGNGK